MSRIGKQPIKIPPKVEIKLSGKSVSVKGPKGQLDWSYPSEIEVRIQDGEVVCSPVGTSKDVGAKHGLVRAMIHNMVTGVAAGFTKEMTLVGVGYRAKVEGKKLILSVGYSNPVELTIPDGLAVEVTKKQDEMTITGIDRQVLGEWCAVVRRVRPPEPYKGKGIRFRTETVKTKQGKRAGA